MAVDVEKLLRADAAGWRNENDQALSGSVPTGVSPSELVHRLPLSTLSRDEDHRGRLAGSMLAAAALVIILAVVGFAVARRPGSAPSTLGPAATSSTSVDPKRPQPPRNLSALGMRPTPATSVELNSKSFSMPWRLSAINDTVKTVEFTSPKATEPALCREASMSSRRRRRSPSSPSAIRIRYRRCVRRF